MKKLLSILLAVLMITALVVPTMAAEEANGEPTISGHAFDMTYYVGGYGAMPGRYQCSLDYREQGYGYGEWFDISFGDPIVDNWPTEAGTYTVTFQKTTAIDGAGDTEYTFDISMNITVLDLPATSGQCGENMTWKFDTTTDTLTISGTGDMYTTAETVDDFWNGAREYEPGWWKLPVKHIVVEEGVENLSNFAFATENGYYEIQESIKLPTTLQSIPEFGFIFSTAIKSLTIPEGVTTLTGWPFGSPGNSFTALTDLYLPASLKEMDITTIMLSGLDNRNATPTLETIHFAGTEEQWNAIKRVNSESIKEIYGDDYEGFYENWCKPFAELFEDLKVVFGPEDDIVVENGTVTIPDNSVEITEGEDVVIDVTDTEEKVSGVVIGSETVEKITDAETAVEIKLPAATVSFDKTAIGSIGEQAGATAITIVAKEVENTSLNAEQKAALGEKEVFSILNLEAFAGESKITEFGGGKVTVSVPFTLPEGKSGADYYVAYVADNGSITAMPTAYTDGILFFETTHFSSYVVLEKEAGDSHPTGDSSHLILFVAVMSLSVAALSTCVIKRRAF